MTTKQPSLVLTKFDYLRSAFWRRRILRWIVRGAWLALLVPTVFMVGYLWRGWTVPWLVWLPLMFLVGVGSVIWSLRPIKIKQMTRRVDNILGRQAQLVTAYEVSYTTDPAMVQDVNPVVEQLIQDSVNVAVDVRQQIKLVSRSFWVEVQTLLAIAAILGAMLVFNTLNLNLPETSPADLPPAGQEPSADDVIPPPQETPPQEEPQSPEQLLTALQILAEEFRDQAITRSIADAIDRGELSNAAAETRRLADQLSGLSEDTHQQLGDNMQEAADRIGDGVEELTDPLEKGNRSLDAKDLAGATESLEELAEYLDSLDEDMPEPPPQAEQQEQPQQEEPPEEEERLPIDGEDFELENESDLEEQVLQPSERDDPPSEDAPLDNPFARQPLNPPADELGPDPLVYPWEKRDIIRNYFTPENVE